MSVLNIENLCKSFGKNRVLDGISIRIEEGEMVSLLGPSGCGKTTLLKLIAGLETADSGNIYIDEVLCNRIPAGKRGAVMVFQDYSLFPHMTVAQNIEFGLLARKMNRIERNAKSEKMLELMQLSEKSSCYPGELSGGQKQRVALARACVLEPKLLLLDEPFSSLDAGLKDVLYEFVLMLQRKLGITTIFVTHDREEAFVLSQKVAIIFNGIIQQYDTPRQIYANPRTRQTADFIGEANYIDGIAANGIFSCFLGQFESPDIPDGPAQIMFRYDHLILDRKNGFPCIILEKKYRGRTTTYHVKTESGHFLKINSGDDSFNCGEKVFVKAAGSTCCFFNRT